MMLEEIEGATALLGATLCVFGADLLCLFGGQWTSPAPFLGDRLLVAAGGFGPDQLLGGEAGRMGRLSQFPDEHGTPMPSWEELPRITDVALRAGSGDTTWGQLVGDDGVIIRFNGYESLLCDTGDQAWVLNGEGRAISNSGETLRPSDPEIDMSGPCLRSDAAASAFTAVTGWQSGTVWGLHFATETQVFSEVTGATE